LSTVKQKWASRYRDVSRGGHKGLCFTDCVLTSEVPVAADAALVPAAAASAAPGAGQLLRLLRDGRPRTRAELAHSTRLARSTVTQRIDLLLASGLVRHAGEGVSTGGRPPTRVAFNPAARVVIGADIGATHARLAVTDLAGGVLAESGHALDIAAGPDAVLPAVVASVRDLLERSGRGLHEVLGVGVGLPGPVEHSTGRPINPPIMPGWDGFDVPGYLTEALGTATLVDNDVNVMALGEHFSHWRDADHLVLVKVATGIGSGIISDGELRRGAQGAAGDLGHIQVPGGADVPCRCGNTGCLEALASGAAVAGRLRELGLDAASSADVVRLVRGGSVPAVQLLREAGRDIGEVLATVVSLLNPSVIVLGGALSQAGEHLLAGVREVVYRRSLPLATRHLRIVESRTGERAGVIGAAVLVLEHALAPEQVDRLLTAG
jgi:predicted NBD/HSP70 family sugar kinase